MKKLGKPPAQKRPLTPDQKAVVKAADYDTGFGKPPTTARFQKGESGNPTGRPKGSRALRTDVKEVLDLEVQVQLPSGGHTVSMQQAMVLSMAAKAAKGDTRAALFMLKVMEIAVPDRLKEAEEEFKLDPAHQAAFSKLLADLGVSEDTDAPAPASEASTVAETTIIEPDDEDWDIL